MMPNDNKTEADLYPKRDRSARNVTRALTEVEAAALIAELESRGDYRG